MENTVCSLLRPYSEGRTYQVSDSWHYYSHYILGLGLVICRVQGFNPLFSLLIFHNKNEILLINIIIKKHMVHTIEY